MSLYGRKTPSNAKPANFTSLRPRSTITGTGDVSIRSGVPNRPTRFDVVDIHGPSPSSTAATEESLLFSDVKDEYDPFIPNLYEDFCKERDAVQRRARMKETRRVAPAHVVDLNISGEEAYQRRQNMTR